jgi:hypothetical protein
MDKWLQNIATKAALNISILDFLFMVKNSKKDQKIPIFFPTFSKKMTNCWAFYRIFEYMYLLSLFKDIHL